MTKADDDGCSPSRIGLIIFGLAVMTALVVASSAAATPPWVSLEPGKATLHASINPHGLATAYQFEWGTSESYGSSVPVPAEGIGSAEEDIAVAQTIDVAGGTTYHYRLLITSEAGTSYSEDGAFTTPDWRPSATTEPVSSPEPGKATLHASINPHGLATAYQFEWGTSESYGSSVPVPAEGIGSAEEDIAVAQTIDVAGGTTYHYRVVATNRDGTAYGHDEAFTAESLSATVPSPPVSLFRVTAVKTYRSGRLDLLLRTSGPGSLLAKAIVTAPPHRRDGGGATRMSYGRGSTTVGSTGSARLTIRSRAAVRRLLSRSTRLYVGLAITYKPLAGASRTIRKVVAMPPQPQPRPPRR